MESNNKVFLSQLSEVYTLAYFDTCYRWSSEKHPSFGVALPPRPTTHWPTRIIVGLGSGIPTTKPSIVAGTGREVTPGHHPFLTKTRWSNFFGDGTKVSGEATSL